MNVPAVTAPPAVVTVTPTVPLPGGTVSGADGRAQAVHRGSVVAEGDGGAADHEVSARDAHGGARHTGVRRQARDRRGRRGSGRSLVYVKVPAWAAPPGVDTKTPIVPVPAGATAVQTVVLAQLTVAKLFPKLTVVPPTTKFVPVMVTVVPTGPDVGERLVTVGAPAPPAAAFTVSTLQDERATPYVASPPYWTTYEKLPAVVGVKAALVPDETDPACGVSVTMLCATASPEQLAFWNQVTLAGPVGAVAAVPATPTETVTGVPTVTGDAGLVCAKTCGVDAAAAFTIRTAQGVELPAYVASPPYWTTYEKLPAVVGVKAPVVADEAEPACGASVASLCATALPAQVAPWNQVTLSGPVGAVPAAPATPTETVTGVPTVTGDAGLVCAEICVGDAACTAGGAGSVLMALPSSTTAAPANSRVRIRFRLLPVVWRVPVRIASPRLGFFDHCKRRFGG